MGLFDLLKTGLAKTRNLTFGKIATLLGRGKLDAQAIEELEELLLEADVGVATTSDLIEILKVQVEKKEGIAESSLEQILTFEIARILSDGADDKSARFSSKPWVILLVGVNGSGKTTTAGKLAHQFSAIGKRTVIAAADTFRAAAIEQVEVWAERSGARLVRQAQGADPAAVAFDAYQSAVSRGDDILIVDTAGRLQAKQNLMIELAKIRRILGRFDVTAPHEVLLVLDATTGQNGLSQARGFDKAAGVTGLIVTKLDGTARGGIVIPIHRELQLPVEFLGLGEGIGDLQPFDANAYTEALLAH